MLFTGARVLARVASEPFQAHAQPRIPVAQPVIRTRAHLLAQACMHGGKREPPAVLALAPVSSTVASATHLLGTIRSTTGPSTRCCTGSGHPACRRLAQSTSRRWCLVAATPQGNNEIP